MKRETRRSASQAHPRTFPDREGCAAARTAMRARSGNVNRVSIARTRGRVPCTAVRAPMRLARVARATRTALGATGATLECTCIAPPADVAAPAIHV